MMRYLIMNEVVYDAQACTFDDIESMFSISWQMYLFPL